MNLYSIDVEERRATKLLIYARNTDILVFNTIRDPNLQTLSTICTCAILK